MRFRKATPADKHETVFFGTANTRGKLSVVTTEFFREESMRRYKMAHIDIANGTRVSVPLSECRIIDVRERREVEK